MDTRTLRLLEFDKIRAMLEHYASTSPGKDIIRRMKPARDASVVRTRLAETSEARTLLAGGDAPFGGVHDVREAVTRAEKQGVLTAAELQDTAETAAASRRLRRYLTTAGGEYPLLRGQAGQLGEFLALEQAVDHAIAANGEVLDSASPELRSARQRVRSLHGEIQRELQRVVTSPSMLDLLQDPIVIQRNGRYCVPVRAEARNTFKGIVHDLSASGQTAFIEPMAVVELGNDLREAERREEEEIYRVLATLSGKVGQVAGRLLTALETMGRLDAIFARAHFAHALDATSPELNTDGIVDLIQARHPLLGSTAVPIDIMLGDEGHSTLVITGPNTGGKTVTLKAVGLLALMAQSGLHIPAHAGSRVTIFHQVFADIGDEQSIEQSLSTFSSHMSSIVRIVAEAEPRALVLLDEVGAGTDPAEGAALAKAILLELHERGCRTIATTHYGELKVFAHNTDGFRNASVEFDLETLRPTYRIITGLPGSSNALAISRRLGLPKPLIARAKELIGEAPQAFEQVLKQAEGTRRALDRERTAAMRARKEAEETAARLQCELRELEEKREAQLARARQQAQETLQKARTEANALLEELRTTLRTSREQPAVSGVGEVRRQAQQALEAIAADVEALPAPPEPEVVRTRPPLTEVRAGQSVIVRSLGHHGLALESGSGDEEVEVQVGIMRVRVPVHDLEAHVQPAAQFTHLRAPAPAPAVTVEPEIHLLGLRAEEASERLEDYLYAALESGLARVRIVHGFGTGALRNTVQELLRHHPAVRSMHAGERREGGGGVTIAELGNPGGS